MSLLPLICCLPVIHYFSNGQTCINTFPWPSSGYIGIQTNTPLKPLHIHGDTNCPIVTERLSYGDINNLQYLGHFALLTPATINSYTLCPNRGLGDIVLQSQIGRENGGNIILNIKDESKKIILATSPFNGSPEYERLKVFPSGKSEFNTGLWNWGLPKITLSSEETKPTLKFYQPTGTQPYNEYGDAYPWYIQTSENSMNFQWGQFANIGSESVSTKVIYKVPNAINGYVRVGINTGSNPLAMLHGTNGSVLFDGDIGTTPVTGAGTRFMWIPSLKAIRAGGVTGTQWDNIGEYSVAFGKDNIASGESSFAMGDGNNVTNKFSGAFGIGNTASDYNSFCFGQFNVSSGFNSISIGSSCLSSGEYAISAGQYCQSYGINSITLGNDCDAHAEDAIAIGRQCSATEEKSWSLGYYNSSDATLSTTMGYNVNSIHHGSFLIGDGNYLSSPTRSSNDNQLTVRFTGIPLDSSSNNIVLRFINAIDASSNIVHMCYLTAADNGLFQTSDRNQKKDIKQVNEFDILQKLRKVPISTWKWKDYWTYYKDTLVYNNVSHTCIGPMAQDFYKEFPFGFPDSTAISTAKMDAVMFASIQALANISDTLKNTIEQFNSKNSELDSKVNTLLTKEEFKNFKDTLYCFDDACKRIEELETIIFQLKEEIDSLKSKGAIKNDKHDNTLSINNKLFDDIILEQNNPNPFSESCYINYYIPLNYNGNAKLIITDEIGREILQSYEIFNGKPCQMTISAKELKTGVYLYGIELAGQIVKSKKMMIIK